MYTALRATSLTLADTIRQRLQADPNLAPFFDASSGGTMVVSLNTPQEMTENDEEGLSVWLYRVVRDDERLNAPPERLGPDRIRDTPLPLRLYYLLTPITAPGSPAGAELEQVVLGKAMQALHDRPILRGPDLRDDFAGTTTELAVRMEPMSLEEIARVWDALDGSYQLSVSYEVSLVNIATERQPVEAAPVDALVPEYAIRVASESS